ncbi:MAG: NAD(P)-binding domain-containing protein, partial [Ilumatobacteraceae bacterium]|nr:NAD(P)-binding domain-containing protein [Ilumatobacteraceae bacterium]
MAERSMSVGYVGLGNLGVHLASSLLRAGHVLTVTDLHQEAAAGLVAAGATWADTAQAVAEASDVVFTCLPSPAAVDAVVAGRDGVLAGLCAGGTWIDNSTNDRDETLRLAALAATKAVRVLEAPVTGGVHKAAAGEITVLVA